jgi:large subunit ribosomal protein L27
MYISKDRTVQVRVDGVMPFQKKRDSKSFVSVLSFEVEA